MLFYFHVYLDKPTKKFFPVKKHPNAGSAPTARTALAGKKNNNN